MNDDSPCALRPDRLSTREEFLRATGDTPERLTEICWNRLAKLQTRTEEGGYAEQGELELAFRLGFASSSDDQLN